MKLLFLCTTEFQLLTALNIKYHMHPDDEVDIIVDNYHGREKELAERIRETKLFRKVFYVKSYIEHDTLHRYFKETIAGKSDLCFSWAMNNSLRFAGVKLLESLLGAKQYIRHMIYNASELKLEDYEILIAYGTKPITKKLIAYLSDVNKHCRIHLLDEGFGIPSLGQYTDLEVIQKIEKCYIYSNAAMHTIPREKICKLPSIKKTDKEFISILNHVFQFRSDDVEDYRNAVIFFNPNGGEAKMPRYLKIGFPLTKVLLRRLYQKHLSEEKVYCNLLALANFITTSFRKKQRGKEIWIKLAPRASRDFIDEYRKRDDIRLLKRWDLPWELLALNCPLDNSILLTDLSAAVCICRDVVEPLGDNIQRILLYRMMKTEVSDTHKLLFENLENQNEDLYIPKDAKEFDEILFQARNH